jgi:hypothetical protein
MKHLFVKTFVVDPDPNGIDRHSFRTIPLDPGSRTVCGSGPNGTDRHSFRTMPDPGSCVRIVDPDPNGIDRQSFWTMPGSGFPRYDLWIRIRQSKKELQILQLIKRMGSFPCCPCPERKA